MRAFVQPSNEETRPLQPFLRWAGGKRWLVKKENQIAPLQFDTYIEPFLGSAAVFFSISSTNFIISDINAELINCYMAIRNNHEEIEGLLRIHQAKHSKDYYYQIRESQPKTEQTKAARFLYLNRTCFNGLYRVNHQGKFNVPIGSKNNALLDNDNFRSIAEKLKQGTVLHQDFEKTIELAEEGDFIFIDPPYTVNHNLNGFIAYNENIFSWEDQVRLKNSIVSAQSRGAMITLTNADHESIHDLYSGLGNIQRLERNSVIAGKACHRKVTSEIIMRFGWGNK